MKKVLFSNLIGALLLASCTQKGPMVLETHDVDFLNRTGDVVHGKFLDLDVAGGHTIAVYDTLLMVTTGNPAALLQVYHTETLKPLAMLCQQGHAANEFADKYIFKSDQTFLRDEDVIIVLRGEGGNTLKEINVSASVREGYTVVEGIRNDMPHGCADVVGLDNGTDRLFIFNNHNYNMIENVYNPPSFSVLSSNGTEDVDVYTRLVDFENPVYSTFWYDGSICKHPSKNIVVQCMHTMDYIHFFNLDSGKCFSIHQKGAPTLGGIRVRNEIVNDIYMYDFNHFSQSIATEDMFLVIYYGGDYRKDNLVQSHGEAAELLAFDWNGNYLGGVKLDIIANDLAYNPMTNMLYGFRIRDEKIVTYDLSGFK